MTAGECWLDFAIDSEQLLSWMLSALWVIGAAILLTWVGLFILRIRHSKAARQREVLQQQWQRIMFEYCVNAGTEPLTTSLLHKLWQQPAAFLWFLQLWSQLHRYVRGDADDGLEKLAQAVRLERKALELMRGHQVRVLIATAIAMGDLQQLTPNSIKRLRELTRHDSSMVVLSALRALMRHDQAYAIKQLLALDNFVAPERLVAIAKECDVQRLTEASVQALMTAQAEHAGYLLRVLQGIDIDLSAAQAEQLALHFKAQPEVVSQLVPLLDHPHHLPLVRRLTQSVDLGVRVQATRMLGDLADERGDHERLWQLLQDSAWWVRYRAAEAILLQPKPDKALIKEQLSELGDSFARSMLMQVQSELGQEGRYV